MSSWCVRKHIVGAWLFLQSADDELEIVNFTRQEVNLCAKDFCLWNQVKNNNLQKNIFLLIKIHMVSLKNFLGSKPSNSTRMCYSHNWFSERMFRGSRGLPSVKKLLRIPNTFSKHSETINALSSRAEATSKFDVVIVGAGCIGSLVAFWLKKKVPTLRILVIDRDLTVSFRYFLIV